MVFDNIGFKTYYQVAYILFGPFVLVDCSSVHTSNVSFYSLGRPTSNNVIPNHVSVHSPYYTLLGTMQV